MTQDSKTNAIEASKVAAALKKQAEALAPHFKPEFLQREHTVFQFTFDSGLPFHLTVTSNGFEFEPGFSSAPTLTLTIDNHQTCWALLAGKVDSMQAFMEGKYRADGNIVLSQLLLYLFKNNDPTLPYQVED